MLRYLLFLLPVIIVSCNESNPAEKQVAIEKNIPDTIYFTEEMRGNGNMELVFDTLFCNKPIPRNQWFGVHAVPKGQMIDILKSAKLFLESEDTNFRIKRLSNLEYQFFVDSKYEGNTHNGWQPEAKNHLQIQTCVQPNAGFVFATYWRKEPFTSDEITRVFLKSMILDE